MSTGNSAMKFDELEVITAFDNNKGGWRADGGWRSFVSDNTEDGIIHMLRKDEGLAHLCWNFTLREGSCVYLPKSPNLFLCHIML